MGGVGVPASRETAYGRFAGTRSVAGAVIGLSFTRHPRGAVECARERTQFPWLHAWSLVTAAIVSQHRFGAGSEWNVERPLGRPRSAP